MMKGTRDAMRGGDSDAFGIRFESVLPRSSQQPTAQFEPGGAMTIGEEAVVADAMEAVRQRVQQEATNELVGVERHDLRLAAVAIISPAERDAIVDHADQPGVGDGDAMGVAAEVGEHLFRPAERWLGVDDPFEATDFGEHAGEGIRLCQMGEIAEEAQPARIMGHLQFLQKAAAKQARQHAHGQEEPRPARDPACAVGRDAPARHDAMQVGMVGESLRASADRPKAAEVATVLLIARALADSDVALDEVLRVLRMHQPIVTVTAGVAGFECFRRR